jgi:phage/plasmid-associated DNA primase
MQEGPMKQLCSGTDEMTARQPYGQLVTFLPQANPVIMTNNPMRVTATDHGTWRRLRRLMFRSLFNHAPVHDDPHQPYQFLIVDGLIDKFKLWKETLTSMCINRLFITNGYVRIELCKEVQQASADYRREQDSVAAFIMEKVVRKSGNTIKKSELISEFQEWCGQMGDRNLANRKNKQLTTRMDQTFGAAKNNQWIGVGIAYDMAYDDVNDIDDDDLDTNTKL